MIIEFSLFTFYCNFPNAAAMHPGCYGRGASKRSPSIRERTTDPRIPRTHAWSFDLCSGKIVSKSCQPVVWLARLCEFSVTREVSGRQALINSRLTLGTRSRVVRRDKYLFTDQPTNAGYLFVCLQFAFPDRSRDKLLGRKTDALTA